MIYDSKSDTPALYLTDSSRIHSHINKTVLLMSGLSLICIRLCWFYCDCFCLQSNEKNKNRNKQWRVDLLFVWNGTIKCFCISAFMYVKLFGLIHIKNKIYFSEVVFIEKPQELFFTLMIKGGWEQNTSSFIPIFMKYLTENSKYSHYLTTS